METQAIGHVIPATEMNIQKFRNPINIVATQCTEAPWSMGVQYDEMYIEYTLRSIFVEEIPDAIWDIMVSYWSANKYAMLLNLVQNATFLRTLEVKNLEKQTGCGNTRQESRQKLDTQEKWNKFQQSGQLIEVYLQLGKYDENSWDI